MGSLLKKIAQAKASQTRIPSATPQITAKESARVAPQATHSPVPSTTMETRHESSNSQNVKAVPKPGVPLSAPVTVSKPQASPSLGKGFKLPAKQTPSQKVMQEVKAAEETPVLKVELDTFTQGTEKYTQEEVEQIRSNLEFIKQNFSHPEIVGDAVKTIMMSLLENPDLMPIIGYEDIGTMVRGLRESHGIHVAVKQEKKRGGRKSNVDFSDFAAALGDAFG